ncbi:unnamed protein product [Moneuplotes crassus]|uniref:Uncharacterized protein n=1 Tax=Euplotes crassus TaxID=5936 RepID=A0AAD1XHK4_EUPCR|nr:unnamed protein product [Moneuplotes crassus]
MSLEKSNKTFQKCLNLEKSHNSINRKLAESCYGANILGSVNSSTTLKLSKKSFKGSICYQDSLSKFDLENDIKGQKQGEDSINQNSQNLSNYSKLSYKQGINSLRLKKALKEKTRMNLKSEKNINNNKKRGISKMSKNISTTSRALIKTPFEMSSKSILKRKSRKGLKKYSEKQSTTNLTQAIGKENRPPKTKSRVNEEKRSSVPRTEKSKLLAKRSIMSLKRTTRKKGNKSKKTTRGNGVDTFQELPLSSEGDLSNCLKDNPTSKKEAFKRISSILRKNRFDLPKSMAKDVSEYIWKHCMNPNSSMSNLSNSRSRLGTKRLMNKNYSTSVEKERKVLKEIDDLYSLVLGMKFVTGFEVKDSKDSKLFGDKNLIDDEEEDEIQTSRFPQSDFQCDLVPDEFSRRKHQRSKQYDTSKNKSVLQKIKAKLKKIKREHKKNKEILSAMNNLNKLVTEELKFSRSTSIPKLRKTGELFNSNLLYDKNESKENNNYIPNPDTFRKLESDRGYESQGINSLLMPNMLTKGDSHQNKEDGTTAEENKLKLPLHLLNPSKSQLNHNSAAVSNRGKIDSKSALLNLNSNRAGDHQSSYNTAEFTETQRQEKGNMSRRKEIRYNKLADVSSGNQSKEKGDNAIEILNYYNKSMSSEASTENTKENKMLKDVLYATIKLVLAQNKQIKKLKEVVTKGKDDQPEDFIASEMNDDSRITDLSLLSIGKDAINPIITVKNFCKNTCLHEKIQRKEKKPTKDSDKVQNEDIKNLSQISQKNIESIDETLLHELNKKMLKESVKSKSGPDLSNKAVPKNNDRYCDNSYTSNGYSFITNMNLLNTSMSPIHKANPCANENSAGVTKEAQNGKNEDDQIQRENTGQDEFIQNLCNQKKFPPVNKLDNSQLSLNYSEKHNDFSEFQDNSNPEFLDNSFSQHGLHQNDKSLDLKCYKMQEEKLKGSFLKKQESSQDRYQMVNDYNTSPADNFQQDFRDINKEEEYSKFQNDNIDTHTLIYNESSVMSKNQFDISTRSGVRIGRYDSEEENPYDESKSDLFNPMM